ncbi:hypothetical protein ACEJ17_000353 [Proteus mirabilis]
MTNSEEIDGLNNRKFTGLLGYEGINSKKVCYLHITFETTYLFGANMEGLSQE